RSSESGCRRRESGWREGLGKKDAGAGGYGVSGKVTEEPVVGEEEEEFSFLEGPSDSETKPIPIILRFERKGGKPSRRGGFGDDGKRVAGSPAIFAILVEGLPMKVVGPALGDGVDHA